MTSTSAAADLLTEAREQTDALLAVWAERLHGQVGGRHGEALAYALKYMRDLDVSEITN